MPHNKANKNARLSRRDKRILISKAIEDAVNEDKLYWTSGELAQVVGVTNSTRHRNFIYSMVDDGDIAMSILPYGSGVASVRYVFHDVHVPELRQLDFGF